MVAAGHVDPGQIAQGAERLGVVVAVDVALVLQRALENLGGGVEVFPVPVHDAEIVLDLGQQDVVLAERFPQGQGLHEHLFGFLEPAGLLERASLDPKRVSANGGG